MNFGKYAEKREWYDEHELYDDGEIRMTISGNSPDGLDASEFLRLTISSEVGSALMFNGKMYDNTADYTLRIPFRATGQKYTDDDFIAEKIAMYKRSRDEVIKKYGIRK